MAQFLFISLSRVWICFVALYFFVLSELYMTFHEEYLPVFKIKHLFNVSVDSEKSAVVLTASISLRLHILWVSSFSVILIEKA